MDATASYRSPNHAGAILHRRFVRASHSILHAIVPHLARYVLCNRITAEKETQNTRNGSGTNCLAVLLAVMLASVFGEFQSAFSSRRLDALARLSQDVDGAPDMYVAMACTVPWYRDEPSTSNGWCIDCGNAMVIGRLEYFRPNSRLATSRVGVICGDPGANPYPSHCGSGFPKA